MTQAVAKKDNKTLKRWLIGGGIALGSFIGIYTLRLISWYNALNINFKAKIGGVSSGNIILNCTVSLDNPKNFALTITKPTIRIYNGDIILASSDPSKEKIKIEKNSTTTLNYQLKVPALSGELYKLLIKAGVGVIEYLNQLSTGEAQSMNLGIKLQSVAYMQIGPGIERKWKQEITI